MSATAEDRYADFYARQLSSPTLAGIYQEVYGEDHPEELRPFGFVTRTDLARFAELLDLRPGTFLVDLGCGRGGPGIALARAAGAGLLGLDPLAVAVEGARELSVSLGFPEARFAVGGFTATGLEPGSCDAVLSVDALWMVWNKRAAFAEVARVLRPGGRFVFSTWEPSYVDHAGLLAAAGFTVTAREEAQRWLERQLLVYELVRARATALEGELGPGASVLLEEARDTPAALPSTPRVIVAATKTG
ncbi:class I SAM-dependent methyltransferase [Nonomuraea sp. NPDC050790]|uniref:class I SAM-dependent methyltransferase n=1 Tax=Nonomuraea sp. NPDC050790 TaxID=3364371 RepID=UPI00378EC291